MTKEINTEWRKRRKKERERTRKERKQAGKEKENSDGRTNKVIRKIASLPTKIKLTMNKTILLKKGVTAILSLLSRPAAGERVA